MFVSKTLVISGMMLVCAGCSAPDSTPAPGPTVTCDPAAALGMAIADHDVHGFAPYALGYPPYAVDECFVLYVAPSPDANGNGELRLRNLTTGGETLVASAAVAPRRPVIAGDWMAWEADVSGRSLIHLRNREAFDTIVLDGPFDHATEPRISTTAVVFTAWLGPETTADTDVVLYEFSKKNLVTIGQGFGQQRFADISTTHVAWTDFAEDPDGRFDENPFDIADIVVLERRTNEKTIQPRLGKQAFPMLGATGKLAFLDWNLVHPEPKLMAYDLRLADIDDSLVDSVLVESIKTAAPYIRPVAHGEWLEWITFEEMVGSGVWRMRTDATSPPVLVEEPSHTNRFAPAATDRVTFVGVQTISGTVALETYAR